MAPNTYNTSTQSFSSSSSASLTDVSSLLPSSPSAISVSNIKNLIPTILDYTNYMLWRELFLPIFIGHGVYGFSDGSFPCPESTILLDDAEQQSSSSHGHGRGRHSNGGRHSIGGHDRSRRRYTQGNVKSFNSPNHTARDFLSLNSKAFVSDINSNYLISSPSDVSWYMDIGASSHMTPNASNLSFITPYNGSDS
ncbi:hypothetical protein HAX54_027762 [Datura stramonium]|uniref:Uncharacterized protein n=1 Tax=Datura stramonium TaxID=4076 RepID=A0ABS8V588_DATST|nr:hypothetical protein [Datura stramonium]